MSPSEAQKKSLWIQKALEECERPLLHFALSIVQDLDRARDTVQETFMRIQTQDQTAIEGHLSKWLFTVCRNTALKTLRKEARYISVEHEEFEHHKAESISPLDEMAKRETLERLMEHVKALPRKQQEVLRLHFHGNHSYEDIAQITGLQSGNVGFILNAAMRMLREAMEADEKQEMLLWFTKGPG